ncbi:MAG TPA: zf-HC2 domain-containing protein, partial [Vicinamibacterales bacterium]|nr:zf-HC2 domain-containing protein [Vicinamibacterales bacterium]
MSSDEHDQLREQAELYVLGALTPADRDAFEAHMASCSDCTASVKSLSPVAHALAYVAPQLEPPSALRARVVHSVSGSPLKAAPTPWTIATRSGKALPWLAAAASLVLAAALGIYSL